MQIKVSNPEGLVVVCGKLRRRTSGSLPSGEIKAQYELITTNDSWDDPTGNQGATQIVWKVFARGIHAFFGNSRRVPDYLVVEGIIIPSYSGQTFYELWRTKSGRPRKTVRLKALYVGEPNFPGGVYLSQSDPIFAEIYHERNALKNSVTYYPQGATFDGWWHSEYESKYRTEPETDDDEFFYDE